MLHDAAHVAVAVANDASVSGGIVDDRGEHGCGVARMFVSRHERCNGRRSEQGGVAGQHEDSRGVVEVVAGETRQSHESGIARSSLLDLRGATDRRPVGGLVAHGSRDTVGTVADLDHGRSHLYIDE